MPETIGAKGLQDIIIFQILECHVQCVSQWS